MVPGGAFLGTLVRGIGLGVGIGLVWALVVENLLRSFGSIVEALGVVQRLLPGTNAGAPVQGQPGGTTGVTDAVGGTSAARVLAAYPGDGGGGLGGAATPPGPHRDLQDGRRNQ